MTRQDFDNHIRDQGCRLFPVAGRVGVFFIQPAVQLRDRLSPFDFLVEDPGKSKGVRYPLLTWHCFLDLPGDRGWPLSEL